jgi:4,5-dihydroxyphthalate decarboxylase
MLADGRLAAIIAPRAPAEYRPGSGALRRLFDDGGAAARDYYRRTQLFPIMHVVGIRKALAETHPWLPAALFEAFDRSRALGFAQLADTTVASAMLPWLIDEVDATRRLMGDDFWSYGLDANRHALDAFLTFHHEQGLSARRLTPEALFLHDLQE